MEILNASKSKALDLFVKAKGEGKDILKELFPDIEFSDNIMDRVKTFGEALQVLGYESNEDVYEQIAPDVTAYLKLKVIVKALNEGWAPDWNNNSEYKWYPWFYLNKPGFRFGAAYYAVTHTLTTGGSRLCFKSEELAKYAANQFKGLYESFLS